MLKKLIGTTMVLIATSALAVNEVYMANEAGGYVVLTHEPCLMKSHKDLYPYHAYATEGNGTVHLGCYIIPSIEDAPRSPDFEVFAVVNFIDEDGESFVIPAHFFSSEKPQGLNGAI